LNLNYCIPPLVTNRNRGHLSRWLFDNHTSYEGAMNMKMSYINDVPTIIILVNTVPKKNNSKSGFKSIIEFFFLL
jgi:hypothetical protein